VPPAAKRFWLLLLLALGFFSSVPAALAQWRKTITCPPGRVYREERIDAGDDQFCALQLPGHLWVRDGPSRWWYIEGCLGGEGSYTNGRKIGNWRECSRFCECRHENYSLLGPIERERGIQLDIPVTYAQGKYVFDFGSCWTTWVTRQTDSSFVELNIWGDQFRCDLTYIPSTRPDIPAPSKRNYVCQVPYAVGVRAFESLDLRTEQPRAGLPQFCRENEMDSSQSFRAVTFSAQVRFPSSDQFPLVVLADMVDVECAAAELSKLTLRLNRYATRIVLDHIDGEGFKIEACRGEYALSLAGTSPDGQGGTLFHVNLSGSPAVAARQRACILAHAPVRRSCAAK
jgi:hypothetical protein